MNYKLKKLKAPASLKQNVLEAVRREELAARQQDVRRKAAAKKAGWQWKAMLGAAATLMLGIMTFAWWGAKNEMRGTGYEVRGSGGEVRGTRCEVRGTTSVGLASTPTPSSAEEEAGCRQGLLAKKKGKGSHPQRTKMLTEASPESSSPTETTAHAADQQPEEEISLQQPETPEPQQLAQQTKEEDEPLTAYERQLLAEFEAKRPLVNACLAEELAQARDAQKRVWQRVREQMLENINHIGKKNNGPEAV